MFYVKEKNRKRRIEIGCDEVYITNCGFCGKEFEMPSEDFWGIMDITENDVYCRPLCPSCIDKTADK